MSAINKIWNGMVNLSATGKIATSLIMKDAVGCALYVSQARSNEKFTPPQRSDIANYDLANGLINIALQLAAVKPIENLMTKVVDSKLAKKMFANLDERLADTNDENVMKLLKNKKRIVEGTVALFSVIICQYFIKRVVSPYFSVPVGEKSKQLGLIKPKLYEGETYTPKNDHFEKIEEKAEVIKDKFEDKFEKFEDRIENLEDKLEDKFELQKDDD